MRDLPEMLIAGHGRQFLTWFHNNEDDPMMTTMAGLHHVTAIAIDPQANIEFCTEVLGLRLIKETVNLDDPSTYHFYYGDNAGQPGTILTFPRAQRNRYGRHHDVRRAGKFTRTLDDAAD